MWQDSRAPRLSKTWSRWVLGGICLVAGATQAAALSVTSGPVGLPDAAILIQERPAALHSIAALVHGEQQLELERGEAHLVTGHPYAVCFAIDA